MCEARAAFAKKRLSAPADGSAAVARDHAAAAKPTKQKRVAEPAQPREASATSSGGGGGGGEDAEVVEDGESEQNGPPAAAVGVGYTDTVQLGKAGWRERYRTHTCAHTCTQTCAHALARARTHAHTGACAHTGETHTRARMDTMQLG